MRNQRDGNRPGPWYLWTAVAAIGLLIVLPGCMPRLDPQEYGETVTNLGDLKESKQEFELPDLTPLDDLTPPSSPLPGPALPPYTPPTGDAEPSEPTTISAPPAATQEPPK